MSTPSVTVACLVVPPNQDSAWLWDCARMMFASARRAMPHAACVLQTLRGVVVPNAVGADRIDRVGRPGIPLMTLKVTAWRDLMTRCGSGAALLLDPDILIRAPFDALISASQEYDVGLTWHPDRALPHPINAGVLLVPEGAAQRAAQFFETVRQIERKLPAKFHDWYGDQEALCQACAPASPSGPPVA